jgi:preprotein translocase SecE subunit
MPKKEVSKNDKKEKKENKHFFKDFKAELKRVIWPTPKQLVNNTVAVIVIVIITAIIVFVLDVTFELVNKQGINRVKEFVETHKEQTENTNDQAEEAINNTLDEESSNNEAENNTVNE